ncbi:hypothetical protein JW988_03305 [Candidatus Bathyarchaeota archaeon]|nr:hypothetical protein [Candidatus Bathyarchaeota archaeon]
MKKKVYGLTFVMLLLFSAVAGLLLVDLASSNIIPPVVLPVITIGSGGSISPETDLISRNGNTYTLTADIQEYPIVIKCSNIILDGAGHTINITTGDNVGLELYHVNNVIVKNITVFSRNIYTIYLYHSSNCLITGVQTGYSVRIVGSSNTITESNTGVYIFSGSNNLITRNNISDVLVGGGSSNMFFKNNFCLTDYPALFVESLWDNGSVGNYWSNYTIKYPNASEVGNTGIGDTSYVIQREWSTTKEYPNVKNVDNYPLMYPYDIENDAIAFPTPEPTPTPEPESFPTLVVATASAASAIAGAALLIYFKNRKHSNESLKV